MSGEGPKKEHRINICQIKLEESKKNVESEKCHLE
jgi:hypothetical protein